MPKKPYEERTDLEKCQSQWTKLKGLHTREEWSAAIVRAATAAEIAANFAIRQELKTQSTISGDCANSLLRWANGLSGKIDRLLTPLTKGTKRGLPGRCPAGLPDDPPVEGDEQEGRGRRWVSSFSRC